MIGMGDVGGTTAGALAMTWARERLLLSYRGCWQKALAGVVAYVDEVGV